MSKRMVVLLLLLAAALPATGRLDIHAGTGLPPGRTEAYVLFDSSYERPRRIWVYTPPGYDANAPEPYPMIVAFDGEEYLEEMPLPRVLDSLRAAGRAPAFVGVFVDDSTGGVRIADLCNTARMTQFLGKQLIPWVQRNWRVTTNPRHVIVTGSSAGGLDAAFVAFSRPDLFGNVWSQSGAFWRGAEASNDPPWEWLTSQINASPHKDVQFVLDVGTLENHATLGGAGPNFMEANRRFRDALKLKGYDVIYREVPAGNHAPRWWWIRLPEGIVAICRAWSLEPHRAN